MSDLSAPVLAVQDLHREFGGVHAVNGASFTVPPGRITGLIGPNGAGKSTALNIIAGALKPSAGTVSYRGQDITGLPSYKVARRGIIPLPHRRDQHARGRRPPDPRAAARLGARPGRDGPHRR